MSRRRLAWGGIAGPSGFVAAWAVGGAVQRGYSPVDDAISRLAAMGASSRPLMTAGLVGLGVGAPVYAAALRESVPGPAWAAAVVTGLATLGVAASPLGTSSTGDDVHNALAAVGYVSLAAVPLLACRPLAGSGYRRAAVVSAVTGAASVLCLAASTLGPAHGLFQRVGLTVSHAWLVASAAWMLGGGRAGSRGPDVSS